MRGPWAVFAAGVWVAAIGTWLAVFSGMSTPVRVAVLAGALVRGWWS